jgi:hypothetical protein
MNNYISKAINKLAVAQDDQIRWSYSHSISNQSDLDNINVEDGKSFNFDWQDVQSKANELEQEQQANIDAKASALAKLSALGLTEEEVQAIIK